MLQDKQTFKKVPFQSTKYRKKELCVDDIKTIGDVYCPTCRSEKCVYISTIKTTSFYDYKKCKACCHVLNIPSEGPKPTIMLSGGDGTHWFARKTSCDYEKEKPSPFFEEISPPITTKHIRTWTKKGKIKSKYGINVSVSYWLMIWATFSILKSFCSISLYSQPLLNLHPTYRKSWSSQSPTTEFSGLSILVPALLLLQ